MPPDRPYFLNPLAQYLPIGGVVSILHRAGGVLLALAVPGLLYLLMLSLRSPADFERVADFLAGGVGGLLVLVTVWALSHHFLAGLRHLGLDIGLGEGRAAARRSAAWVMAAAIVLTLVIAWCRVVPA